MKRVKVMLVATGMVFSGFGLGGGYAKEGDQAAEAKTEATAEEEPRGLRKLLKRGGSKGKTAGPDGVDERITLTPVTDGSLDWKYRPVLRHHNIAGASEISSIVQIPDWVPLEKREDPTAKYYIYHSNHGSADITMDWAASMEDLCAGRTTRVIPVPLDTTILEADPDKPGHRRRVPATIGLRGAIDLKPLSVGHISAPDVTVDHENKRFVMHFHGDDKGQFMDLVPDIIADAEKSIRMVGHHMAFAATSPYGRNFNPPTVNGIPGGGIEGYGPVLTTGETAYGGRQRMVVMGYRYGKRFEQHGRYYTLAREGILSRAPLENPYDPAANGHTLSDNYWPRENQFELGSVSYNDHSAVTDFMKGKGVIIADELKLIAHPNRTSDAYPRGDINHIANKKVGESHLEIFVVSKGGDWPDVTRVVLDITSEDWKDWNLEHDENGVIFDVAVDHASLFQEYSKKPNGFTLHPEEVIPPVSNPSIFIDNEGMPDEKRYITFSYVRSAKEKSLHVQGQDYGHLHGIAELVPIGDNRAGSKQSATVDIDGFSNVGKFVFRMGPLNARSLHLASSGDLNLDEWRSSQIETIRMKE
jgi:hypothetical protein